MERRPFGVLSSGEQAFCYTISSGKIEAHISDFGATLVRLFVPDREGKLADVVLGFDDVKDYASKKNPYFGSTVGRNANRIQGAAFELNGKTVRLAKDDSGNNCHSAPDSYAFRLWTLERHEENLVEFSLKSSHGDQGFPGNAEIRVTYAFKGPDTLSITYDAVSDRDTVFNLTNHSYFNLAGHEKPECAMNQTLCMPARFYTPGDLQNVPTGEKRSVEGTPMDFRKPKTVGQDVGQDYACLTQQKGYDHNFEVFCNPCAILTDPVSGRTMAISTDCPGIQVYSGNFLKDLPGKDGAIYCCRGGLALETQFYPDAVHHPEWPQPIVKAGERYHSETEYTFK